MVNRRSFLKLSAATGAAAYLSTRMRFLQRVLAQMQGTPLPGSALPQFIEPLPLLSAAEGPMETVIAGTDEIRLTMKEFKANVLPTGFVLPNGATYDGTWVWGYRESEELPEPAGTYIGPVIVAGRGTPTQIKFVNELTANNIAWREWTDQTLHWADPEHDGANMCMMPSPEGPPDYCSEHYEGLSIPAVPHLHGGEQPPVIDGGPEQWFTQDGLHVGNGYYSMDGLRPKNYCIYRYPNVQEAAPLWFHDHLLGGTRINVYAGLAGAYVLTDPGLTLPTGLDPVGLRQGASGHLDYVIPLVLQDRMFDTNGQLYFPNVGINPEHPFWIPEFVGDTIVVNGKVWPFLNVEPRRYRFLLINGSNARAYELFLVNPVTKAMGPPIWQIETDGGYLDAPVKIDPNAPKGQLQKLTILPGERAGFIIDFAGLEGQTLLIRNTGRTPYPQGETPHGATLGQIMQIRVGPTSSYDPDESYNPASDIDLRGNKPIIRLVDAAAGAPTAGVTYDARRQLTLNEVMGPGGPLEILVNNTKWSGMHEVDGEMVPREDFTQRGPNYLSELPEEGKTELWEIINLTADAHPIHTHLTQFQLMNRQNFNMNRYEPVYNAAFPGGVFIPAFGPPANYTSGETFDPTPIQVTTFLGGNPDVTPYLQGPVRLPDANEAGWKDTVRVMPGQVTRFIVRFAPFDTPLDAADPHYAFNPDSDLTTYVWHCHIIDHEDNEMMRPYTVTPKSGANRDYEQGIDY